MRTRPFDSISSMGGLPFEEDGDIETDAPPAAEDEKTEADTTPPGDRRAAALEAELKRVREANRKMKEEAKARQEAEAAKRGEFEALYKTGKEELEKTAAKLAALEERETKRMEAISAANKAALKALPDDFRALVPDGLDPETTATQIARVQGLVGRTGPDGGVVVKAPKPTDEKIPDAVKREADRLGYTDTRAYYEKVWKPRQERQKKR